MGRPRMGAKLKTRKRTCANSHQDRRNPGPTTSACSLTNPVTKSIKGYEPHSTVSVPSPRLSFDLVIEHVLGFDRPPGTVKTSFCQSIARALTRSFQRITLGGVRETKIQGHRWTYVAS